MPTRSPHACCPQEAPNLQLALGVTFVASLCADTRIWCGKRTCRHSGCLISWGTRLQVLCLHAPQAPTLAPNCPYEIYSGNPTNLHEWYFPQSRLGFTHGCDSPAPQSRHCTHAETGASPCRPSEPQSSPQPQAGSPCRGLLPVYFRICATALQLCNTVTLARGLPDSVWSARESIVSAFSAMHRGEKIFLQIHTCCVLPFPRSREGQTGRVWALPPKANGTPRNEALGVMSMLQWRTTHVEHPWSKPAPNVG